MSLIIGLTGGIASGKTTVADLFQQHFAIQIVDADVIAREVVKPKSQGLEAIIEHFGREILLSNGELDRSALREIIFTNSQQKQWLNALLHPMIRAKMQHDLHQATSPYVLFVVPLLVENNLMDMIDRLLVVDVDEQTQINRTMKRDNTSEEQAKAILASQASRQQRLALADDVIENHTNNRQLMQQITKLHKKYLAICN